QNVFTIIHPDDRDQAYTKFQRLLQHPEVVQTLTYRAPNAAGKWRWFEASAINHLHFPAIRAVVVNFRDIHDRKLAQESLHQSEEIFRLIFHATNVGVAQADPSTRRLLQVNDAYCRITGYTED